MSIKFLAMQYNQLQMQMGSAEETDFLKQVTDLLSENFTKTANGEVLAKNRDELTEQIAKCRADGEFWVIQEKDIIPSQDNQKCTIRYIISTENAGSFDVIGILGSRDGTHIDFIDEVYYCIQ